MAAKGKGLVSHTVKYSTLFPAQEMSSIFLINSTQK